MDHSGRPPGPRRGPQPRRPPRPDGAAPDPLWPDEPAAPVEEERWPSRRGMRSVSRRSGSGPEDFENGWFAKPTEVGGSATAGRSQSPNGKSPANVNGQANGQVNGRVN